MDDAPLWECQRSVEADVTAAFAWQFMTQVSNWSDPPAEFVLHGPFAPGTQGTTRMPGHPLHTWTIRDVDPGRSYTIDGSGFLAGAQLLFHWQFEALSDRQTRITQRIELCGANAAAHLDAVKTGFEPNLEPGLKRITGAMVRAARTEA